MARQELKAFYNSDKWQKVRLAVIAKRGPVCQKCGKVLANALDITGHHSKELTPENYMDAAISLNPDNILLVCKDCHNAIHNRFGYRSEQNIHLVYGPPLSGKTSFVKDHMQHGDLAVDMDTLYRAVSLQPEYDKPNELLNNVMGLRDLLIDNIKTRYGKWHSAWIVGGYPEKYRREQLAQELGAELIFCDVSRVECLARLDMNEELRCRGDEWTRYINKWFERYAP